MASISGVIKMPTRPCWVNGRKGMFHRYIDKTETVFINECNMSPSAIEVAKEYFDNTKIIPNGYRVDKIVTTYALIEFEDGHIEEIPPTTITFLEHGDFECYLWGDEKDCCNCKFDLLPSNAARPCYECKFGGGDIDHFTRK